MRCDDPREQYDPEEERGELFLYLAIMFVLFALVLCCIGGCSRRVTAEEGQEDAKPVVKHDSLAPTYTYDGEIIRWYVFTDPDTDVQYLVNDRGGCTPRLTSGYGSRTMTGR